MADPELLTRRCVAEQATLGHVLHQINFQVFARWPGLYWIDSAPHVRSKNTSILATALGESKLEIGSSNGSHGLRDFTLTSDGGHLNQRSRARTSAQWRARSRSRAWAISA